MARGAPGYTEAIVVKVYGQPGSQMRTLYRLALTTAFGTVPPFGKLSGPRSIQASYDYTARIVEVRLLYNYSGFIGNSETDVDGPSRIDPSPAANRPGGIGGPQNQDFFGGNWPVFVGRNAANRPGILWGLFGALPNIPDEKFTPLGWIPDPDTQLNPRYFTLGPNNDSNVIMTYRPGFTNPAPDFDQSTRTTTDIVSLATQLILNPCCQPQPPNAYNVYTIPTASRLADPGPSGNVHVSPTTGETGWIWNVVSFQAQVVTPRPWTIPPTN